MTEIVVTVAELVETDAGPTLRMEYALPDDEPMGPDGGGGHQHFVPVTAVWQRMVQYGLDSDDAIEECVLETAAADLLTGWPNTAEARAAARLRHTVVGPKGMVPEPTDEQVQRMRCALGLEADGDRAGSGA